MVKEFIKKRLGVTMEVVNSWISGNVIIATLENKEMQDIVMKNKYKLEGRMIFIENDLTWKEMKIQEKINKWVKVEKGKGRDRVCESKGRRKMGELEGN